MDSSGIDLFGSLYGTAPMKRIFSVAETLRGMIAFEVALARAQAQLGIIPQSAADTIERTANVESLDLATIITGTENVGFPVIALTKELARLAGAEAGAYIHFGATTQDAMDTSLTLALRDAFRELLRDLDGTIAGLAHLARKHRDDVMAGRTLMQQALPVTFGYTCALWLSPLLEHRSRLVDIAARLEIVQFGGAVGTLASLGDRGRNVGEALARELKLRMPDAPWHTDRTLLVEASSFVALLCGSLAKIATDVILLGQTEVGEVAEPYVAGRGASSTMPQKRNPVASGYILGATRAVHALASTMFATLAVEHERSPSTQQTERIVLPQLFSLASGALAHARAIAEGLTVDTARMRHNLDLSRGLIMAEALTMALSKQLGKAEAHHIVTAACNEVLAAERDLLDIVCANPDVARTYGRKELADMLEPVNYLGDCNGIIDRILSVAKSTTLTLTVD